MSKITSIEIQKRNKNRCNIFIDGEYSFSISNDLVYKNSLKVNMEVNEVDLLSIADADNFYKCKESALRIVERSYKSEKELRDKLIEKGYGSKEINKVIDFLKEYNFINNRAYAEMYCKDRIRSQGSNKIKYSLIRKGIEENIINEVISNIDNEKEEDSASELCRKKYEQLIRRENDVYKIKNKLYTFLVGRGYNYSLVKDVINKVINNE